MRLLLGGILVGLAVRTPTAAAQGMALDPLVRVRGSADWVPGPASPGVGMGMDSRLTRLLFLEVAGFFSPRVLPEGLDASGQAATLPLYGLTGPFRLRHGLVLAPGFRIPHRQPAGFLVELLVRVGAGPVWLADFSPHTTVVSETRYEIRPHAALVAGLQALVEKGRWGLLLELRPAFTHPWDSEAGATVLSVHPQVRVGISWRLGSDPQG